MQIYSRKGKDYAVLQHFQFHFKLLAQGNLSLYKCYHRTYLFILLGSLIFKSGLPLSCLLNTTDFNLVEAFVEKISE